MPYFILLRHYDIAIIDITPLLPLRLPAAELTPAFIFDRCHYFPCHADITRQL
jgi:hypothetical protein